MNNENIEIDYAKLHKRIRGESREDVGAYTYKSFMYYNDSLEFGVKYQDMINAGKDSRIQTALSDLVDTLEAACIDNLFSQSKYRDKALEVIKTIEKEYEVTYVIHDARDMIMEMGLLDSKIIRPYNLTKNFNELQKENLIRDGLITIGAESNTGKTSLVTSLALDILANNQDTCFLFYSLDDHKALVASRMICQLKNIKAESVYNIYRSYKNDTEFNNIFRRVFIYETMDIDKLEREIDKYKELTKKERIVVGIDYLQIIPHDIKYTREAMSGICNQLKAIQKNTGCMMLLLTQMNRDTKSLTFRYRETSEIENVSDVCMDIQRVYTKNGEGNLVVSSDDKLKRKIVVMKNKLGLKGITYNTSIDGSFNFSKIISDSNHDNDVSNATEKIKKDKTKRVKNVYNPEAARGTML